MGRSRKLWYNLYYYVSGFEILELLELHRYLLCDSNALARSLHDY